MHAVKQEQRRGTSSMARDDVAHLAEQQVLFVYTGLILRELILLAAGRSILILGHRAVESRVDSPQVPHGGILARSLVKLPIVVGVVPVAEPGAVPSCLGRMVLGCHAHIPLANCFGLVSKVTQYLCDASHVDGDALITAHWVGGVH